MLERVEDFVRPQAPKKRSKIEHSDQTMVLKSRVQELNQKIGAMGKVVTYWSRFAVAFSAYRGDGSGKKWQEAW